MLPKHPSLAKWPKNKISKLGPKLIFNETCPRTDWKERNRSICSVRVFLSLKQLFVATSRYVTRKALIVSDTQRLNPDAKNHPRESNFQLPPF